MPIRLAIVYQKGRQHFPVAVLGRVHVEHELDQHPFQLGHGVEVKGEARARYLGRPGEIQGLARLAQFPVRAGSESECGFFPPLSHLLVAGGVVADGTESWKRLGTFRRKSWNSASTVASSRFQVDDHLGKFDRLQLQLARRGAAFLQLAGFLGQLVFPALHFLVFSQDLAAAQVQGAEALLGERHALGFDFLLDQLQVVADKIGVQHGKNYSTGGF